MDAQRERSIALRFDPNKGSFATINNPEVSDKFDISGEDIFVAQPGATSGLCLSFPLSDFKVTDKKCIRSFRSLMRQLVGRGREFCMELSDELADSIFAGHTNASLWFVGYSGSTGVIGITWE